MTTDTTPTPPAKKGLSKAGLIISVGLLACCGVFGLSLMMGGDDDPPATTQVPVTEAPDGDVATDAPVAEEATEAPVAEAPEDTGGPSTIPGLVAVDIYGNLENRGFTCERNSTSEGFVVTCRDEQSNDVVARGSGPTSMNMVTATSMGLNGGDEEARALLGFVASVPYDGAEPDSATGWVEENVGKNAEAVFGGAKFRLIAAEGGTARILEITPAE